MSTIPKIGDVNNEKKKTVWWKCTNQIFINYAPCGLLYGFLVLQLGLKPPLPSRYLINGICVYRNKKFTNENNSCKLFK